MKRFTIGAMATFSMSQLTGCVVAGGSRSNSGGGFLLLVFPIALALLLASLGRRRHGRRGPVSAPSRANDDSVNRQVLEAELSVLADDVLRLEPQVAIHEQARGDYEAATHRYRVARGRSTPPRRRWTSFECSGSSMRRTGRCPEREPLSKVVHHRIRLSSCSDRGPMVSPP